jgi:hypothetical protein
MKSFLKSLRIFSLVVLCFSIISPGIPVQAAIDATDYFQLTAAGDATTMDSGATLVFTLNSKVAAGTAKTLAGDDYAFIEIMSSNWSDVNADMTAVGGGITVKSGVTTPWGDTTAADISGTSDNLVAVNVDATGTGTFTVRATESFNVYVWAMGASMNGPDTGDGNDAGTPPGQDFRQIAVANASSGADHLKADFGATTTAEPNEQKTVTITQVNSGGGLVSSALTDVVIDTNATTVAAGTLSGLMESSAAHAFGSYGIIKFTSAANTTAYYMASVISATTFKAMGGPSNVIYSNSNIIAASGLSAGAAVAVDPGDTITKDVASVVNVQGVTTLIPGDIVSLPGSGEGECGTRGYFSVVSAVNNGADSTVTVMGPVNGFASCITNAGNITKITITDGAASAYTVSNGAVGVADGYIYSVGGTPTGNQTTTVVTGKTLTNGSLSAVVVGSEEGAFTVTPYSPTVNVSAPTTDSLTIGAATDMTINGYGPMNGQNSVPTMAPIDFFLSKDPATVLSFPITNAADSAFSITSGGVAVAGQWYYSAENWGSEVSYRVSFSPTLPCLSSTVYTVAVAKSFAASKGSTDLIDGGSTWTSTFTTGTGGGNFMPGGEFTGTMGGEFPPMASMGYPMQGAWDVPTNVNCVIVDFDRPMTTSDLTTSNIYIKKVVSGALSATLPAGTETVTVLGDDNDSVCIAGYTYEASSEYCVVVDNDVKDAKGNALAGMPGTSAEGCGGQGMGFGFANMGPFEASFHTGTGAVTVTASFLGTNLDTYLSSGSITGVPVGFIPRVSFNGPLNPSTVTTANITLKKNGSVNTAGSVYYNSMDNAVEFVPDNVLSASTSYTLNISASVTSISGTAVAVITKTFTTGAADVVKPRVVYAEADNYGVSVQFDEPLNQTKAENGSYYTLKTCSASTIAADGASCGSGSPTTVSLLSGVNLHYEREENKTWMDGLTLTPGDGFYIGVSTSVTDIAANGFHATDNKSWTGSVMDGAKFGGGQGMFQQDTMGMEDFNMKNMGMMPVGAWPMNSMANTTTLYFLDIPLTAAIPADGYIELTFPTGTDVSGALQDQYSPMNNDFNGPSTGSPTFKAGVTSSVSTDTASSGSGTLDNGIGYISAARKVYIQLSATTQATDFLHIDLGGIKNPSEPKDFDTSGYQVDIKTFNSSGTLLESMTTMPYFISEAGTNSISGQITAGGAGVNGVRVFLDSWAAGFQETTTSLDGAGTLVAGNNAGEYKFENLPDGNYHIFVEPSNGYTGGDYNIDNVSGATTKNIALTTLNGDNCATLPVTINIANIGNITSLGSGDSVDVFGWNTTGMGGFVKTLTRQNIIDSVATPIDMFMCNAGMYNIGVGPALPKGTFSAFPKMEWMPPQNQNINVLAADIGGSDLATMTFAVSAPDAIITGIVKDSIGTVVSGGKVFADFPAGGFGGDSDIAVDGTFSIPASTNKSYRVGAFIPGMPPAQDHFVSINASGTVYVDGNPTASTGSSGGNPLVITMQFNSANSLTVSGRVSDGTNAISGAGIWAHRTDAQRPPVNGFTDSSGNYILYIPEAGTWQVEANAPGLGFLGSKTLTVTTDDFTGQDFEPLAAAEMGSIAGDISVPGTDDDSGVVVTAYNTDGFFNTAITESDGTYTMDVPKDADAYTVVAWSPTLGELVKTTQVVDGTETVSPASLGTPRTFIITLEEAVSADTFVDLESSIGMGTDVIIPAGETVATVTLPEGNYYFDLDLPFDETEVVVTGAEFNAPGGTPVTTDEINIDGTGDNITLTLPDLNTVSGTIEDNGTGVENALVTIIDTSTQDILTVLTDANGDYTVEIPDGTYSVLAEQSSYVGTPEDITITTNSPNQDITLDPADQTIAGTITNSSGSPVEGALVYATMSGGGMAMDETDSSGNYEMHVSDGIWNVEAITDGYIESGTPLAVNATNANVADADIQLPATTVALEDPSTTTVDSSNANKFADTNLDIDVTIPANSVDADAVLNFEETNELPTTPSANPFSTGVDITGTTTNDSTTITGFDNDVDLAFEYTIANLATEGITLPAEMQDLNIGYMNEATNNWTSMPTAITYFDSTGTIIPDSTIEAYATFVAAATGADLATIELSTSTDHLTTFAPIISSGATPPATPSTPVATVGDSQVTLTWTKNSEGDMSRYDIWEANVTEGVLTTLTQAACTVSPCTKTISSLTNGTAYSFQIIAVDTDGNSSAGSTAAAATPVAATVTTSNTGGGTTTSSRSSRTTATSTTAETTATATQTVSLAETVSTTPVDVAETGIIAEPITVSSAKVSDLTYTVEAETEVVNTTTEEPYTAILSVPVTVATTSVSIPADQYLVGSVYEFGPADTSLSFSKPVQLTFPLPASTSTEVVAYYFDTAINTWAMAGDGGEIMEDAEGNLVLVVSVDHFTKFAVMKKAENKTPFTDVAKHWSKLYVEFLYNNGVINGKSANIFAPDDTLTRAELTKIIVNLYKFQLEESGVSFSDVGEEDWCMPYVRTAKKFNLIKGYDDGTFKPEQKITRVEALSMLLKAAGADISKARSYGFKDIKEKEWYTPYVNFAAGRDIVKGYGDGTFGPHKFVTRGEISKMAFMLNKRGFKESPLVSAVLDIVEQVAQ